MFGNDPQCRAPNSRRRKVWSTEGIKQSLQNQTDKEGVKIQGQTMIGTAELTTFVLNSVQIQNKCEASKLSVELVNQVHKDIDLDTNSEFSSSAQSFLSSIEMSKKDLSENEKRKRTDARLLKPMSGPDLFSALSSWGEEARDKLDDTLHEYEYLFMNNESDIGKCKIAKHRIELEPEAVPHREGECGESQSGSAKTAGLSLIQPSY